MIKEIGRNRAHKLLTWLLNHDTELIAKNHVLAGRPVEECLEYNLSQFNAGPTKYYTDTGYNGFLAVTEAWNHTWITMLYVSPLVRQSGLGKAFVEKAKEITKERLYTAVPEHNTPANKFYKKIAESYRPYIHGTIPAIGYRLK